MRTAVSLVILTPLVTLTSALTTTTNLVGRNEAPAVKPVCPVFQDVMSYNSTTRELSAFSYVEPLTTPASLTSFALKPNEDATLTAQLMPADQNTTIKFNETQSIHVGGSTKLLNNPVFGSFIVNEDLGYGEWEGLWPAGRRQGACNWDNVEEYLLGGGAGLRLKRENLSTLTVDDLDNEETSYTAEPAANEWIDDDSMMIVFTHPLTVDISVPWANTMLFHITPTAFWPDSEIGVHSDFAVCVVTKANAWARVFPGTTMDYEWTIRGHGDTLPGKGCRGLIFKQDVLAKPPTPSPTSAPTTAPVTSAPTTAPVASYAVKATAQMAIVLGLFVAVSLLA